MSAYLSGLIGTFSTDARTYVPALAPEKPTRECHIGTVAMFNPSWGGDTENLDLLRRQILFFDTDLPQDPDGNPADPAMAAVNIVGLLRGTQALSVELGPDPPAHGHGASPLPLVVLLAGGSYIVAEIVPGYFLVCFAAILDAGSARHEAVVAQVHSAVTQAHAAFTVLHPPVARLEALLGRPGMSACFERHWRLWRRAYNGSAGFGPPGLAWPSRLSPGGFLGMLPDVPFQRLTVRASETLAEAAAGATRRNDVRDCAGEASAAASATGTHCSTSAEPGAPASSEPGAPAPSEPGASAVLVFHTDGTLPKKRGLVHLEVAHGLLPAAVGATCRLLELLMAHDALEPDLLARREPLVEMYSRASKESAVASGASSPAPQEEPQDLAFLSAARLLDPSSLTDALVVLPLNYSVAGIKSLGLAVNDKLAGVTLWWPGRAPPAAESSPEDPEDMGRNGRFVTALGPLLVYLPCSQDARATREYLLVLFCEGHALLAFLYDSGLEQLGHLDFYSRLQHNACEPLVDMLEECVHGSLALGSSLGSLPGPLSVGAALAPDTDFFFVVYDTVEKSYQSSLPPLDHALLLRGLWHALFHLHDQLVDHFVVKSAASVFCSASGVEEHLHKFSSSRANDWMFYLVHHKHKRVVVIRNYNKNKAKAEPKVPEDSYLHLLADSVYDYGHLGFLDSLGDDVKVWLEGLRRSEA